MLESEPRFTEEGLAFALNHRMHQLGDERGVAEWLGVKASLESHTVGVTPAAFDPLGGLTEAIAALVLGHEVVLEAPTPVVAAFLDALADVTGVDLHTASRAALLDASDMWILRRSEEDTDQLAHDLESIPSHESRAFVGVVDARAVVLEGKEDQEALSGLAEDLLLHEGLAPGTPRIVWAPAGVSPDALLNALVGFRELFPAHPDTDGTLALPTAFLVAAKQPHATGPGFLVSLGPPEAQAPGHIRWVEYYDVGEVERWMHERSAVVVAASSALEARDFTVPRVSPGDVHRPPLDPALPAFLRSH